MGSVDFIMLKVCPIANAILKFQNNVPVMLIVLALSKLIFLELEHGI